ncbi:MAG: DGQHR domain-containing protein [Alphaproteobacteria bacterium]|nr:DGQHR domain-containing protein [Alphaproteobacteria bacterium]MBU1512914.1 DGQHR domain-containing protein [Alphaproteobacteria bacterium]MBU2096645.1 DGQHR domain-containing protein [Alphaproteobacteria bacterium]MBU2150528.1 DGQHR domain-containing protein [Alphaproteobacteria bacterium]MBU2306543.1 DGQHR domain-containing protein [Alphaproteobacteria bacterium]
MAIETREPPLDLDNNEVSIVALKATQPIGDLYIGSVPSDLLIRITDFDVRRKIEAERDVERYLGIQRPLDDSRVRQLNKYVNFVDATFPTACILAVDAEYASYDEGARTLILRNYREGDEVPSRAIRYIARVLDGQHRIAGLREFRGPTFEVPVVFFVGADIAEQANIFSTVNLEQNKVGRSLAYDLFALAKTRSPQRLCHEMAVAFDADPRSPFYQRIKRLGVATPGRYRERLSQAQFVEAIMRLITREEKVDRDILLRGGSLPRPEAKELERCIFRGMFVDGRDMEIARSVDAYFRAVRDRWPEAWNAGGAGDVLNKTNGFRALMRLLRKIYNYKYGPNDVIQYEDVLKILTRSKILDDQFTTENYKPGTSGETQLYRDLRDTCGLPED